MLSGRLCNFHLHSQPEYVIIRFGKRVFIMPINQLKKNGKAVKDKSGRQGYRVRINFTDTNGKPQQVEKVTYGLAEAKLLEQQLIAEYKNKQPVVVRKTIQELFNEYEVYHSHETRQSSHNKAMQILRTHVLPTMAECRLDRLSKERLAEWKNGIAAQDLSIVTKKNIYQAFNAMLNYAVKLDYLQKNPLTSLGTFKDANRFDKPEEKIQYYTAEQFVDFLAVAKENAHTVEGWGFYVFFAIAFYTGARKGEIHALRWSDIEGNIIHIRRSVTQKIKGEDVVETPPKNPTSIRNIQAPKPLLDILAEHKERQRAATHLFTEDFRVCGGERPLRDTTIAKKNIAFADAAGLPHIRIHDFRHSHVSVLVNEGVNIQEIARRLGHADIKMTLNTYSHLYPREEERAVKILDKIVPK